MDQHLSETEFAVQSLRAALKELEIAAIAYGDQQRSRNRNHHWAKSPFQRVTNPDFRKAGSHRNGWQGLFSAGREVWRLFMVKLRGKG